MQQNAPDSVAEIASASSSEKKEMARWRRRLFLTLLNLGTIVLMFAVPLVILLALRPEGTTALILFFVLFFAVLFAGRIIMFRLAMSWGMSAEEYYATRGWRMMLSRGVRNYQKAGNFWRSVDKAVSGKRACPNCNGTGNLRGATCPRCGGTGQVISSL